MAKHQLNRADCRSTTINPKLRYERDEIARADSKMFELIFGEMERLHQLVTKPREQVVDAKALLDITKSLVMFVKGHANGVVTLSEFVSHIFEEFGGQGGSSTSTEEDFVLNGPIYAKVMQRKAVNRRSRKHVRPNELARLEELGGGLREVKADTDKNMLTMFNILRKNSVIKLENLILNRNSFAQTVENLFALSFLVKDGRAEIKVNEAGSHYAAPRNAPRANAVRVGDVAFSHFVFRLDFKDWKLLIDFVGVVEDLMPRRE
ncbi:non-structural maintenance of chromosomes element 4 homolog B-like [Arachis hypogaea]|uniref:non-structural maintenance of chromosomes element 4 homolog B-like n=1 Tax=Arachis hypogaea TaxID=3818 RepID=UPI0011057356|nr:non-structural maintenance of chromosomes element 4 homolog B-like [Arachis hypogaea]